MVGSLCPQDWGNSTACPYGTSLPGDVTLPNGIDFGVVLAIAYSFVPYGMLLVTWIKMFWHRGTKDIVFNFFGVFVVALGELLFKKLVSQPRPQGTCLQTCGMPSSHSSIATGYLCLVLLETLLARWKRCGQVLGPLDGFDVAQPQTDAVDDVHVRQARTKASASPAQRALLCLGWALLLAPVPFSRVVLKDHSWAQVGVGALVGVFEAIMYYVILNTACMGRALVRLGLCSNCLARGNLGSPLFVHNYVANHQEWKPPGTMIETDVLDP